MIAREIMTRDVITVHLEDSVDKVARLLAEKGISGAPVVNDENKLVGIVTEGDFIVRSKKLRVPTYFQLLGGVIYFESPHRMEEELRKMTATKVKDIMTEDVISIVEETPVEDNATIMVERKINRLPVVRNHKVVGIVSRSNLVKAMVGLKKPHHKQEGQGE